MSTRMLGILRVRCIGYTQRSVQDTMFDFNPIKFEIRVGPSITYAPSGGPAPIEAPGQLSIPWQDTPQAHPDVLSLLSWRTFLSDFAGFDKQMEDLRQWAMSAPNVSLKFIIGEGGVGKTRTAAEFARHLHQRDNWAAGFVDLRKSQSYILSKKGNLLIVDYPEEQRSQVAELLTDFAGLGSDDCPRVRVLFLTRRSIEDWRDLILDTKAAPIVDWEPVVLRGLSAADAYTVFCSAQERAAQHLNSTPVPVSDEQLTAWLGLTPENNRALFIVAAAVHSAIHPDDLVVQYNGAEVVKAIAEREVAGLRKRATEAGLEDPYVLARILSIAAVAGGLTADAVTRMANARPDLLGMHLGEDIKPVLGGIAVGPEKVILAPKPDILAAALVVRVLSDDPDTAPELI